MNSNYKDMMQAVWTKYSQLNPQAVKIHNMLNNLGEEIINDHIAFRTLNGSHVGLESHIDLFEGFGYEVQSDYYFSQKKLLAVHMENKNPNLPKIFISELVTSGFSSFLQKEMASIRKKYLRAPFSMCFNSGRLWDISFEKYKRLAEESEYAAWFYLYGLCANHFTVLVNNLSNFESLEEINQWLKSNGMKINNVGGEIKGSPGQLLEQSSTVASKISLQFKEGEFAVPGCYYEFAKRYLTENKKVYSGFITSSANKIFESTSLNAS